MDYQGALSGMSMNSGASGYSEDMGGSLNSAAATGGASWLDSPIAQAALYGGVEPKSTSSFSIGVGEKPDDFVKRRLYDGEDVEKQQAPPQAISQQEPTQVNRSLQQLEQTYLPKGFQPW